MKSGPRFTSSPRTHDKRQLGAKLGKCPNCGRTVWSNQPNTVLTAKPLSLIHDRC